LTAKDPDGTKVSEPVEVTVKVIEAVIPKDPVISGNPGTAKWGSKYSFTPTETVTTGTWEIEEQPEALFDEGTFLENIGLAFDEETGKIWSAATNADEELEATEWKPTATVLNAMWKAYKEPEEDVAWDGSNMKFKVTLKKTAEDADDEHGFASKEFELAFEGIKATITGDTSKTFEYEKTYGGETEGDPEAFTIAAYGPGNIAWDLEAINEALPRGLTADENLDDGTWTNTLTISGKPDTTCKNESITFKANNGLGEVTHNVAFTITTETVTIEAGTLDDNGEWTKSAPIEDGATLADFLPGKEDEGKGNVKVDDEFDGVLLRAYPGPIDWTETNLTATGLDFKVSDDTEYVTISGKYTTERTITDAKVNGYTITA
jgi:hypothetical protein